MRIKNQISLSDIHADIAEMLDGNPSEALPLIDAHIDFESLIPTDFYRAYHHDNSAGRPHINSLESMIRFFSLQRLFGFGQTKLLLTMLKISKELRDFCCFDKIPDASVITRFKQKYVDHLRLMFSSLVDKTEPICREIDSKKADYLIFDTTGIEPCVTENNPKFINTKLKQAKNISKSNPGYDPYKGVYGLLPDAAEKNADARQQYINGHYCYAMKAGILTNGLGIVRDIAFFDSQFKDKHPDIVSQKTDNPDLDKEIADSKALRPVLSDFYESHPNLSYSTFLGDSAFDSYDIYGFLRNEFSFSRVCIPINIRNSASSNAEFDGSGVPVCPLTKENFSFDSMCGGKNRSARMKWICPGSVRAGSTRRCECETPCTESSYGRCVYTYPDKDFRLYPGIPRGTEHWNNLYRRRVIIERTINLLKDSFGLSRPRTTNTKTVKADLYIAGITQLIGVLLAKKLNEIALYKSVRKLIAKIA